MKWLARARAVAVVAAYCAAAAPPHLTHRIADSVRSVDSVHLAQPQLPARAPSGPSCASIPLSGDIVRVANASELSAAARSLESGQTVVLAPGTYHLQNTIHIRGGVAGVAFRGETGKATDVVLVGRGMTQPEFGNVPHGFLVSDATDVLIADLTVRDVFYHAVQIAGESGPERVRLHGVALIDAGEQLVKGSTAGPPGPYADDGIVECSFLGYTDRAPSWYTNGVDVLAGKGWVIRDNVFHRIRAPAGQLAGPAVLMWRNSLDTVVERNWFIDCDRGIALGLDVPDARYSRDGEATYDHQGGVVRNNVVWRSPGSPTGDTGIIVNYARDYSLLHNTVLLNGTYPLGAIEYRFGPSSGLIRGNLTDRPILQRDGASAVLLGNLDGALADWFADADTADLHLHTSAPAVDAVPFTSEVADDVDGETRRVGVLADAGADELSDLTGAPAAPIFLPALSQPSSWRALRLNKGAHPCPPDSRSASSPTS